MEETAAKSVISYDSGSALNHRRGVRVVSWYWLGILLAVVALAAVVLNGQPRYVPLVDRVQRTATLVGVALLFHVVPATFGVALGLWIRQRRDLLLRYRRAVAPVMWGFFGFALQLVVNMPLVGMAVCVGYSVVAGLSLCGMPGTHDQASGLLARRFRRVWIATGVMMGVGIVGGYLSAWMSRGAVERRLAERVAGEYRGRPFKVVHSDWGAERIFRENGIATLPAGVAPDFFPWGDAGDTRIESPFVVSGKWDWCAEAGYGGGGKVEYFCLFGWVFEIGEPERWAY